MARIWYATGPKKYGRKRKNLPLVELSEDQRSNKLLRFHRAILFILLRKILLPTVHVEAEVYLFQKRCTLFEHSPGCFNRAAVEGIGEKGVFGYQTFQNFSYSLPGEYRTFIIDEEGDHWLVLNTELLTELGQNLHLIEHSNSLIQNQVAPVLKQAAYMETMVFDNISSAESTLRAVAVFRWGIRSRNIDPFIFPLQQNSLPSALTGTFNEYFRVLAKFLTREWLGPECVGSDYLGSTLQIIPVELGEVIWSFQIYFVHPSFYGSRIWF